MAVVRASGEVRDELDAFTLQPLMAPHVLRARANRDDDKPHVRREVTVLIHNTPPRKRQ